MLGSLVTWSCVTIGKIVMELAKRNYSTHDQQLSNYLYAYLVTKMCPIFH